MSDGRRGPQAPPVAGDESVDDGDFYATVSASAGATRSTRIKAPATGSESSPRSESVLPRPEPTASRPEPPASRPEPSASRPEPSTSRPEPSASRPEPVEGRHHEAFDGPIDEAVKPSTEPSHAEDAVLGAPASDGEPAQQSRGWRDRWNALAASVTGKTATSGKGAAGDAKSDEVVDERQAASVGAPVVSPVVSPAAAGPVVGGTVAYPGTTPPELKPKQSQPVSGPRPLVDPPTATIPAVAAAATGTAVVSTTTTAAAKPKAGAARRTRKARLRLSRIDPWSVMKTAFLFSIAAGIVLVVAVYVVWTVIGSSGLFSSINEIVGSVVSTPGDTTPFRIEEYVNTQKVMGVTAFVAAIDVVIFTALATLCSFLYNLAATMLGGLEVTLAED